MLLVIDSNKYSFDYAKRWEDDMVKTFWQFSGDGLYTPVWS